MSILGALNALTGTTGVANLIYRTAIDGLNIAGDITTFTVKHDTKIIRNRTNDLESAVRSLENTNKKVNALYKSFIGDVEASKKEDEKKVTENVDASSEVINLDADAKDKDSEAQGAAAKAAASVDININNGTATGKAAGEATDPKTGEKISVDTVSEGDGADADKPARGKDGKFVKKEKAEGQQTNGQKTDGQKTDGQKTEDK